MLDAARRASVPHFRLTAAAAAIALAMPLTAQTSAPEGLSLSGTTRLRYEAIAGQARAGFNEADDLINVRTTLLADYRDGPVRVAAELWDSRVYGDNDGTPVTTGEVNAVELVQAFVEVRTGGPASSGSGSIAAGRFVLNLGSRRLVAADDYRNTTNGYTGIQASLNWDRLWKATLIYTLPQQRRPDDLDRLRSNAVAPDREGFDLVLWGGVVSRAKAIGPVLLEGTFLHLGERDRPGRPTRDRSLNTVSLRAIREPASARFDGEVEAIGQAGEISTSLTATAPRQAVRAWSVHADAGYTFADAWKTRLSVDYDHASGDGAGGRYGRFDTLFGMRRADYSPAGLYSAIARSNIVSPGVRVETVPDKRTDLMASARPMWLAAGEDSFASTGVRDASGGSGRYAGFQLDGRVRHQPLSWLRLELDGVLLAKGRFLRSAPNAPDGRWTRYVSLNALATF